MKNKLFFVLILQLIISVCLVACGNDTSDEVVEEISTQSELTDSQQDYLDLAKEVDVLRQKEAMLLSLRGNPDYFSSVNNKSKFMTATELMGMDKVEEDEEADSTYMIDNIRSFWVIYDSLQGYADESLITSDDLEQIIDGLKNEKAELEKELSGLEEEIRAYYPL